MSEDVSNSVRIGVTVIMLSMVIAAVLNLFVVGMDLFSKYTYRYQMAVEVADNSVITSLEGVSDVSAATAYRIIEERVSMINMMVVERADGTVSFDYRTLLNDASMDVKLEFELNSNGKYTVVAREVVK